MSANELLGVIAVVVGIFFSAAGIIGFVRLPDIYTRIHAAGKVSTVGIFGLALGVALIMPETTLKLIGLIGLLLITAPVATHAIAYAAHRQGVARADAQRDDLADWEAARPPLSSSADQDH